MMYRVNCILHRAGKDDRHSVTICNTPEERDARIKMYQDKHSPDELAKSGDSVEVFAEEVEDKSIEEAKPTKKKKP